MTSTLRPVPKVSRWSFDAGAGQINALDAHGQVLMAIPANALFGARLAAAFCSPPPGAEPVRRPPLAERLIAGDVSALGVPAADKPWLQSRSSGLDLLYRPVDLALPVLDAPSRPHGSGDSLL